MPSVKLGEAYRDVVSGYEGVAVAYTLWLNGCLRVCLQPKVNKDGKLPDNQTFDFEQLKPLGNPVKMPGVKRESGGDRPDPPLRKDPK